MPLAARAPQRDRVRRISVPWSSPAALSDDIQRRESTMMPGIPTLGVRFDIQRLGGSLYGLEAWKIFWSAVDPEKIRSSNLFEGDTDATLKGRENVFCVAIRCLDNKNIDTIKAALRNNDKFLQVAASPIFAEGVACISEPLCDSGRIDASGNLFGKDYWSYAAGPGQTITFVRAAPGAPLPPNVKDYRSEAERDIERQAVRGESKGPEIDGLIEELIQIGNTKKFLGEPGPDFNEHHHNIRTREIGQVLHEKGGKELMQFACYRVGTILGGTAMGDLESARNNIGDWLA